MLINHVVQENLGVLLLGIFFNTYLFGIVSYQYSAYLTSKSYRDPLWIVSIILALLLIDAFISGSLIYLAWTYLISNFSNIAILLSPQWPYDAAPVITAISALLTHIFLIYRVLHLTNRYIACALFALALGSFAFGVALGVKAFKIITILDMLKIRSVTTSWLTLQAATDISISTTLIIALERSRTGFTRRSNTVINRLLRTFVQTGLFTSLFATLALIFFLAKPMTMLYATFGLPIGRLYSNTLMDTLLCREELRGLLSEPETLRDLEVHTEVSVSTDQDSRRNLQQPWSRSYDHRTSVLLQNHSRSSPANQHVHSFGEKEDAS